MTKQQCSTGCVRSNLTIVKTQPTTTTQHFKHAKQFAFLNVSLSVVIGNEYF